MIGLLAIIGAIVISVWLFNRLKRIGISLARLEEVILDRFSAGFPGRGPSQRRGEELERLGHVVEAVRNNEFPDEEEIKDEIEKLTS